MGFLGALSVDFQFSEMGGCCTLVFSGHSYYCTFIFFPYELPELWKYKEGCLCPLFLPLSAVVSLSYEKKKRKLHPGAVAATAGCWDSVTWKGCKEWSGSSGNVHD